MDITILEKDLDRRFRVIDIYPALLLNPDYSDVLDPDSVFYWDPDQLNSGQRIFTISAQSVSMLYEVSAWLLKHGYRHFKLFPFCRIVSGDVDWSINDLQHLESLGRSAYLSVISPGYALKIVINRNKFIKFTKDLHSMFIDLNALGLYVVLKMGRFSDFTGNEFVLKQ